MERASFSARLPHLTLILLSPLHSTAPTPTPQVKEEIMEIVAFLRDPARFLALGARSPAGVLLVGAPGAPFASSSSGSPLQQSHYGGGSSRHGRRCGWACSVGKGAEVSMRGNGDAVVAGWPSTPSLGCAPAHPPARPSPWH